MKKFNVVIAAGVVSMGALFGTTVQAQAIGAGVVIGANQTAYAGATSAQGAIKVEGNAVAATQIGGNGISQQKTLASSGGIVSTGGVVTPNEAKVIVNTSKYADVQSSGVAVGVPIHQNGAIVNGGGGYGNVDVVASGNSAFNKTIVGGATAIGGVLAIGPVAVPPALQLP